MINALTIDVEDYFQVSAFERHISREDWNNYPSRATSNTMQILDVLDEYNVKATFFVLGWVAEREPGLVKKIQSHGHEVASHGFSHFRVNTQSRTDFRDDIRRSKKLLENLTGKPVHGYRAPSYSISLNTLWAFEELIDAGYVYDSSVFPVRHDLYGIPHWPRYPFYVLQDEAGKWAPERDILSNINPNHSSQKKIREIPITTLRIAGKNIPISGGGYFRFFPYEFTKWGLCKINHVEKQPFVFYIHPWEFDPNQPRIQGAGIKSRFRHYLNLHKTESRFNRLLTDFRFSTIKGLLENNECNNQ